MLFPPKPAITGKQKIQVTANVFPKGTVCIHTSNNLTTYYSWIAFLLLENIFNYLHLPCLLCRPLFEGLSYLLLPTVWRMTLRENVFSKLRFVLWLLGVEINLQFCLQWKQHCHCLHPAIFIYHYFLCISILL